MKSKVFTAISLALNLALIVAIAHAMQQASVATDGSADGNPAPAATPHPERTPAAAKWAGKKPLPAATVSVTNAPVKKFMWNQVEAADFRTYMANLRSIECPEETICDIIVADVEKLYAAKSRALHQPEIGAYKYWQQKQWWQDDANVTRKERDLEKEKRALLIDLLGVATVKEQERRAAEQDDDPRTYPFLSEDKRDRALEIVRKFDELDEDINRKYHGYRGEEYLAETKENNARRRAKLAGILTPQELEEFELRNSPLADDLSSDMRQFDASEQEYRALFKIKKTFQEVVGEDEPDPDDQEAQKKWSAANETMEEEMKSALGAGRYKEYERSQEWEYQQLTQLARRQGLPPETAGKVYDLKDAAQEQANTIRADQTLTDDQRKAALLAIRTETETVLTATLGDTTFKKFKNRTGGWLNSITR